jgi:pyrroline-5-carboxylate reductase
MSATTIACIGSGNMGFALMKGIAGANDADIGFTDLDAEKASLAASALGGNVFCSNIEATQKADFIFLAVKPQVLAGVLAEIAPVLRQRLASVSAPVLVSMAAGWSIGKIQTAIAETGVPIARIMPNTPALIAKGLIALAVSPELGEQEKSCLASMLTHAGTVDCIEENLFDAVTGLSGSGPAFAYLFVEALADGGVLAGLPREKALRYAAQTVLGSAAMVLETGKHPGELKDMVCSPGGTTIAGVATLEMSGFRSAVIQAVQTAWQKSIALSEKP